MILAAYVAYLGFGHLPHVWAYDSAYDKLTVGNSIERVERIMGRPDEVRQRWDDENIRTYVYRVFPVHFTDDPDPPEMFGTRWMIDVNQHGRVVALYRTDNPC